MQVLLCSSVCSTCDLTVFRIHVMNLRLQSAFTGTRHLERTLAVLRHVLVLVLVQLAIADALAIVARRNGRSECRRRRECSWSARRPRRRRRESWKGKSAATLLALTWGLLFALQSNGSRVGDHHFISIGVSRLVEHITTCCWCAWLSSRRCCQYEKYFIPTILILIFVRGFLEHVVHCKNQYSLH